MRCCSRVVYSCLVLTLGGCGEEEVAGEKEFGQVELSFETGDEVYLLAVYALPTGEAAPDELVTFTLDAGGESSSASALRLAPARKPPAAAKLDTGYWDARLAWEAARRIDIEQLVKEVRAGRRSFAQRVTRQSSCSEDCGTSQMCWKGACTANPVIAWVKDGSDLPTSLVRVVSSTGGIKINVLVDDTFTGSTDGIEPAAQSFAEALEIVHDRLGLSGHSGALDHDGDGRLTVVFSDKLTAIDADFVGGFSTKDFTGANNADLMWARVPSDKSMDECDGICTEITRELSVGTLVHEYTHLVNFATRVIEGGGNNEVLWLDEGMAHLMEDVTGYGASNIGAAAVALDEWPTATFAGPNDSVAQRGMAYTLLRHIVDRETASHDQEATASTANTTFKIHSQLLGDAELGFEHPIFQNLGADGIWQWLLAVFATGNSEVTESAANDFDFLTVDTADETDQPTGFDPYETYRDARGEELYLEGPTLGDGSTDEISDVSELFESEVAVSGAVLLIVTGLDPGTTTLTGTAAASANIHMRAQRVW